MCRGLAGKNATPNFGAVRLIGKWKLHHETEPAQERRIERFPHIRRQDRQATVRLHPLKQVADLHVGVTIMTIFHLTAFPEERVCFVEKKDGAAFIRGVKDAAKVLFGLADVFAYHGAQVDAKQIEPHFVGQDFGSECFAGTARAAEERAQAEPAVRLPGESPTVEHLRAMPRVHRDSLQRAHLRRGQDDVCPGSRGLNPLREIFQTRPGVQPAGVPQSYLKLVRRRNLRAAKASRRRADRIGTEVELRDHALDMAVEISGSGTKRLLPGEPLFVTCRFVNLDREHCSLGGPTRFTR